MKLTPLMTQIHSQCPSLANRLATGSDLDLMLAATPPAGPFAYVLVEADWAGVNRSKNATQQTLRDRFDVVVWLDASADKAAQAQDQLHDLRAELWRALVGFKPGPSYNPIEYDGGERLSLSSTRLLYRLRFFADFQLGRNRASDPAETWGERELDGLPSFSGVTVRVDAIDPADPNLQRPGPDGRLELIFSGDVTP